jgi:hypothetical protein
MMLVRPFLAELIRTIGLGSRKRRMSETGKSIFANVFMETSPVPYTSGTTDGACWRNLA